MQNECFRLFYQIVSCDFSVISYQINPNFVFRHLFPKVVVTQKHKQSSQTFSALVHFLLIFANCCQKIAELPQMSFHKFYP